MNNHWDAEITLLDTDSEITGGFDEPNEKGRAMIFAERKSATRTEFYTAGTINRRIDEVFDVNALDYNGEIYLLFEGHMYDVVRSYMKTTDLISLSCQRRGPR